jgi:pilus assembly protein CpaB
VAAVSASILVNVLRADPPGSAEKSSSSDIEVAMAKTSLPAMSVITSDYVVEHTASKDKLPEGQLCTPAQAIGRVLAVPVVKGQVLTEACFVTQGTGAQLAAALPYGMRAVSLTLSGKSLTGGLLYPGCVVDVLAAFKLSSTQRSKGEGLSTTLLRGVQVLAVEGKSVISKRDDKAEKRLGGTRGVNSRITVTLMVDPRQAEALQLAAENGSISLAMRNPLDRSRVPVDATVLSQGRLARLGSMLTPAVFAAQTGGAFPEEQSAVSYSLTDKSKGEKIKIPGRENTTEKREFLESMFMGEEEYAEKLSPNWGVTVIRGREVEQEEFDIPEEEVSAQTDVEE